MVCRHLKNPKYKLDVRASDVGERQKYSKQVSDARADEVGGRQKNRQIEAIFAVASISIMRWNFGNKKIYKARSY